MNDVFFISAHFLLMLCLQCIKHCYAILHITEGMRVRTQCSSRQCKEMLPDSTIRWLATITNKLWAKQGVFM